ncbi:MAG: hypothetical protein GXP30_10715, partial [Verrucomicrobia bacterium]|nr:hypothetical protein [Verrucomicrobiota bacterium]
MSFDSQQLKKFLDEVGISYREVEGACVLEYRDGVASELVEFEEEERSGQEVVREFQDFDERRWHLTNAFRHLAAERNWYLDRSHGHKWHFGKKNIGNEIDAYTELNLALDKHSDDDQAFHAWISTVWIWRNPSQKELLAWLVKEDPPSYEIEYDEGKHDADGPGSISLAISCARGDLGFVEALLDKGKLTDKVMNFYKWRKKVKPGS